jgi:hypothetical protein
VKSGADDAPAVAALVRAFVFYDVIVETGIRAEGAAAHGAGILWLIEFVFVTKHKG